MEQIQQFFAMLLASIKGWGLKAPIGGALMAVLFVMVLLTGVLALIFLVMKYIAALCAGFLELLQEESIRAAYGLSKWIKK